MTVLSPKQGSFAEFDLNEIILLYLIDKIQVRENFQLQNKSTLEALSKVKVGAIFYSNWPSTVQNEIFLDFKPRTNLKGALR